LTDVTFVYEEVLQERVKIRYLVKEVCIKEFVDKDLVNKEFVDNVFIIKELVDEEFINEELFNGVFMVYFDKRFGGGEFSTRRASSSVCSSSRVMSYGFITVYLQAEYV
jgi:hypothetical protein